MSLNKLRQERQMLIKILESGIFQIQNINIVMMIILLMMSLTL